MARARARARGNPIPVFLIETGQMDDTFSFQYEGFPEIRISASGAIDPSTATVGEIAPGEADTGSDKLHRSSSDDWRPRALVAVSCFHKEPGWNTW